VAGVATRSGSGRSPLAVAELSAFTFIPHLSACSAAGCVRRDDHRGLALAIVLVIAGLALVKLAAPRVIVKAQSSAA